MGPFYGWGSTASKLQQLRGGSVRFTKRSTSFDFQAFLLTILIMYFLKSLTKSSKVFMVEMLFI